MLSFQVGGRLLLFHSASTIEVDGGARILYKIYQREIPSSDAAGCPQDRGQRVISSALFE